MIGGMLGFVSRNGVSSVDDLTVRSWNAGTSQFDVVEHVETFDIDASNRSAVNPAHDLAGDLTFDGTSEYTYDGSNRLAKERQVRKNIYAVLLMTCTIVASIAGSAFGHLHPTIGRFLQRDPIGYVDGMNDYQTEASSPTIALDPSGQALYKCIRPAQGMPGNHAYLYSTLVNRSCALFNSVPTPGSNCNNPGDHLNTPGASCSQYFLVFPWTEAAVMACCEFNCRRMVIAFPWDVQLVLPRVWIPFCSDCHTVVDQCTRGLILAPVPGRRGSGRFD
jgi:hypothetical protein